MFKVIKQAHSWVIVLVNRYNDRDYFPVSHQIETENDAIERMREYNRILRESQ